MTDAKKTALYNKHKELKAKMLPFAGWMMPIQYQGVIAEHRTVREACGVFDVSHMGEVRVKGSNACAFLNYLTINDVSILKPGQGQYSAMLNQEGGVVDDLILYCLADDDYLLCINAANTESDTAWIHDQAQSFGLDGLDVEDQSESWGQLAVQGPKSQAAIETLIADENKAVLDKLAYMGIAEVRFEAGSTKTALLARTGYTGEHGYEIYAAPDLCANLFSALVDQNLAAPVGLGARDTLRLEACYLLYGQDMNQTVSPIEAGIGWAVKTDKGEFIGRNVVMEHKSPECSRRKMVGFVMEDKGIARSGMDIYKEGQKIGVVTSGSQLPSLDKAGGMALIMKDSGDLGDMVEIDVRGKRKLAKIVRRPLYSPRVK